MDLKLTIVSSDILKELTEKVKKSFHSDIQKAAKALAAGAYNKAEKLAEEKLSSSLANIYKSNLYIEPVSENITVIGIREEALWIEEGRKGGFMDELLKNAKTSKEGYKYKVIPMKQKTSMKGISSNEGKELVSELKNFFRKQGIRYSKTRALAMDSNGSPRIGKIHSFNIKDMRDKKSKSAQALSKNLKGVTVSQNMNPKTGKVERNIMTFRVISEKSRSQGKWNHPGTAPARIMDETFEWVQQTWQNELLPALRNKYGSN